MSLGEMVGFLGPDGPMTAVRPPIVTSVEPERILSPREAHTLLARLFGDDGGIRRRVLCDLHQLVGGRASVSYSRSDSAKLARDVLDAAARGDLALVDGWHMGNSWTPARFRVRPSWPGGIPPVPPEPPREAPRSRARAPKEAVLWAIELEHRYHDDAPVRGAPFKVKLSDGSLRKGTLDSTGRARVDDVPDGAAASVQFGPDGRPWESIEKERNPAFKEKLASAEVDGLIERSAGAS